VTGERLTAEERRFWAAGAAVALMLHLAGFVLLATNGRERQLPVSEPVVMLELADNIGASSASAPDQAMAPSPAHIASAAPPVPLDIPPVRAPLPREVISTPPQQALPAPPQPVATADPLPSRSAAVAQAAPVLAAPGTGVASDSKARRAEADYFALISAHLNRRKTYPVEAKRARQEGVVTIRFTVDRTGSVSGAAIKRGSGHDILDQATLELLQRVAPLPRMPASMQRDSITLSLPIEYALRTN